MIRVALDMRAAHHPEVIHRHDALLCSINDRLGSLLTRMRTPSAGQDIAPMDTVYLDELLAIAEAKAIATEEAMEEARDAR